MKWPPSGEVTRGKKGGLVGQITEREGKRETETAASLSSKKNQKNQSKKGGKRLSGTDAGE